MRGKTTALGAVTALALTALPGAVATAAPPARQAVDQVTLVTGDKVLLGPDEQIVAIEPGEGRGTLTFKTHRGAGGHTMVVPEDAFGPLAAGRLDRRLFDVTTLLEFGYRDRMPLIVDGRARLAARNTGDWSALKASGDKIWLDGLRKPVLDRSVAQIGAPAVHERGITGKGVKVAIVDTGVDENHPDLVGQQIAEKNFTDDPDTVDRYGHGTHVGATVASHGAQYGGVAPGVQLIDAKVCSLNGCQDSWILEGMRWAAEQGAQVINLSLGGTDFPEVDPLEQAVDDLTAEFGVLFVIASGNDGSTGSVNSPGSADAALTVGAVDRDDSLAWFSSRGPRVGDSGLKPEVTAPGVGIVAAAAGTNGDHIASDGTSMAAPHVAGAAALLLQQHPDWTPAQLKSALASTAKPTADVSAFDQGAGRVDVAKASDQVLTADAVTLNFGRFEWPHDDNEPVTKRLTYFNPTDETALLDIKFSGDVPRGSFTVSADKLFVPAKGSASVDVIADTRATTREGTHSGEVVATSGSQTVRTLVGFEREGESYTLALDMTDREGQDPGVSLTFIDGLDNDLLEIVFGEGDSKLRLPRGTYIVDSSIGTSAGTVTVIAPNVVLTSDQTVQQDARLAKPISITAPLPVGDLVVGEVVWRRSSGDRAHQSTMVRFGGLDGFLIAQSGGKLPPEEMSSLVTLHANAAEEENTYFRLAYPFGGGLPDGLTSAPRLEDLARVESTVGTLEPGSTIGKGEVSTSVHGLTSGAAIYPVGSGNKTVDLVTTEDVSWQSYATVTYPNGAIQQASSAWRRYEAGKTYREAEVQPVFSPGLPPSSDRYGERYGHAINLFVPMVADATNGSGASTIDSARTALYRNGTLVGEVPLTSGTFIGLPMARGDFRAEMSVDRRSQFEFSTEVSAAWTFKSDGAEGRADTLPLSVVRFAPKLDAKGSVPAGTLQRVGLSVQSQGDTGKVRVTGVEYSHDDGKTWRRAGVVGDSALIYHPADARWASLRATATDAKGNTAEVTVIHAHKVG
ncbi:Serine protease, subtilisin family [Lentzea fradiae]|uniref:Serine protease, subtilisin family n=1 Tax=Lentzea fradiae TaxID=200378 RepID=A0A1G7XS11_9PSEU|nr:S8 family serine peptidase [Lentzea fradiae]SDG86914.1 Serine protease, subtilisin family [Lentzea fradiae]